MSSWWSRWFGGAPAPAPAPARPVLAPAGPPSSTTVAPTFGARRPLVGIHGEVAGFEFRLAPATQKRLQSQAEGPAAAAHAIALLSAMRSTLASGRVALGELPASLLGRSAVAEQVPDGAWIVVQGEFPAGDSLAGALTSWRTRGVRLGAAEGEAPPPGASFVLFRAQDADLPTLLAALDRIAQAQPTHARVVLDLAGVEAIEQVLEHGAALAAGRVEVGDGALAQRRIVQPATQRLCQLLNDVVADRDTAQIGAALRADLALSYRLLRFVNSPAVGLAQPVESVEQAVMVLGRAELYRWLSVLLTASGAGRKASRALQEVSLARARLLELLAPAAGAPPAALFTVGLLSMLDALLQVPLAEALAPLQIAEPAREAIVERRGPWWPLLQLAMAVERHDLAEAEPLAAPHGGLDAVLAKAEEAWGWSAALSGTQATGA
ncbi:MAG: HDOD domain-containing protein [Burkholderiaceae bacterium]|nr:MAG: HDOD domain-containing protein [Burkholderiaceae bacterium]